jgi:hypothetical protein
MLTTSYGIAGRELSIKAPVRLAKRDCSSSVVFAAAAVLAEAMEAKLANGEEINITEHGLLCSTMVRVARQIGINRIPKTVTDLDTFLEARERAKRSEPGEPKIKSGSRNNPGSLAISAAICRASGGPVFLGSELRQADNVIPMERIKPNSA